jgi:hypothetical protein
VETLMGPVKAALRELAGLSATGALHVEAGLGAVLYLREGKVTHVDAAASPGIGRVLLASGRLTEKVWGSAINAGARAGRVGALLVEQGHLTQGELELCVATSLHDASFFALGTEPTSVRFASGESSWFGTPTGVAVELLVGEAERRREILDRALSSAAYDEVPFAPVARLPRFQMVLDGLRWELLIHADGRRTPLELARLLGRGGYVTLLETRRLAAAGLLRLPSQGPEQPPPDQPPRGDVPTGTDKTTPAPKATNGRSPNGSLLGPAPRAQPVALPPPPPSPHSPPPLPRRRVTGWRRGSNQPTGRGQSDGGQSEGGQSEGGRGEGGRDEGARTEGRQVGEARWPTPPPEVHTEAPTVSMLARFRDALEGLR